MVNEVIHKLRTELPGGCEHYEQIMKDRDRMLWNSENPRMSEDDYVVK